MLEITTDGEISRIDSSLIILARTLLDSASLMTERLAKRINIPFQQKETLPISTFGSQCSQTIDTCVVRFTKENSNMDLYANVLSQTQVPFRESQFNSQI